MKLKTNRIRITAALFAVMLCSGSMSHALAATDTANPNSRIDVSWVDPAGLSEVKYSTNRGGQDKPSYWLGELRKHLVRRADARLATGDQLAVKFTDVQLAGNFEPWRGPAFDRVRVVKDIYPPRIDLSFTLTDANGSVIASGERKLRDMAFLSRGSVGDSDNLRYEKRLLDDWLSSEFGKKSAANDAR